MHALLWKRQYLRTGIRVSPYGQRHAGLMCSSSDGSGCRNRGRRRLQCPERPRAQRVGTLCVFSVLPSCTSASFEAERALMRTIVVSLLFFGAGAGAFGCSEVSDFRGGYRGLVVGSDDDFIRRGFPPGTELSLDFDPSGESRIGTFTTTDGSFSDTPLGTIDPLRHDQLSLYDFPGDGRIQNYILVARPLTGPLAGRDAIVFLSLMEEETVEVRVVVGVGDEANNDRFGLFRLTRQ